MSIARASLQWFVFNILSAIISFLGIVYFSRVLGARVIGIYFLFNSLLQLLNLFSNAGLQVATIKRISEGNRRSEFLAASLSIRILVFMLISLIIFFNAAAIDSFLGANLHLLLIVILGATQFSDLVKEALQGENRVGTSGFVEFVQQSSRVVSQIGFVLLGAGIFGLISGMGIGLILSIAIGFYLIDTTLRKPSMKEFNSLVKFSKFSFGNFIAGYIYEWSGIAIIGLFLTHVDVGIYSVSWSLTTIFLFFSQAIAYSIFPKVSELSIKDPKRIPEIFFESFLYSPMIVLPAFIGSILLSSDLLGLVYGETFRAGYLILILHLLSRFFQSLQGVSGKILEGMNRPDILFGMNLVLISVNLSGSLLLVNFLGFLGVAIATTISVAVILVLNVRYVVSLLGVGLPYHGLAKMFLSASFMGVILWILLKFFTITTITSLGIVILIGLTVYFVTLMAVSTEARSRLYKTLRSNERYRIKN